MTFFLLMFLKEKFVAHLFLILLVCVYQLGLSETILLLLYTVISRSVPQPDVSAASAVCRSIDIFNKICIWLIDISQLSK
jgi:hypothetical protein